MLFRSYTANLPRADSTRYPQAFQFGLAVEREALGKRVDSRVNRMFENGLIEEVDALIKKGLLEGRTARAALGYAQVVALRAGEISHDEAISQTKLVTRQYIRRQETWFRRDQRIKWLPESSDRLGIIQKAILHT